MPIEPVPPQPRPTKPQPLPPTPPTLPPGPSSAYPQKPTEAPEVLMQEGQRCNLTPDGSYVRRLNCAPGLECKPRGYSWICVQIEPVTPGYNPNGQGGGYTPGHGGSYNDGKAGPYNNGK